MTFKQYFSLPCLAAMLLQIVFPLSAFSTNGPDSPEFASFNVQSSDGLVDLFTGDLNYNLPLLTVPGPGGGYPIQMGYNSNIGMEEEASWVGLGWNLQIGAIDRRVNGIPDDFKKEKVLVDFTQKPVINAAISVSGKLPEFTSFEIVQQSDITGTLSINSNNYSGWTVGAGISPDQIMGLGDLGSLTGTFQIGHGQGVSLSPSVSFQTGSVFTDQKNYNYSFGANYSSRRGLADYSFSRLSRSKRAKEANTTASLQFNQSIPSASLKSHGWNVGLHLDAGVVVVPWTNTELSLSGSYSQTTFEKNQTVADGAYGLMYVDEAPEEGLKDYSTNASVPNTDGGQLPIAQYTPDIFQISGPLFSGAFKVCRKDIGVVSPTKIVNQNFGGSLGVEAGAGVDFNIGSDGSVNNMSTRTGRWKNGLQSLDEDSFIDDRLDFTAASSIADIEPAHYNFKLLNAFSESQYHGLDNSEPFRVEVGINAFAKPYVKSQTTDLSNDGFHKFQNGSLKNINSTSNQITPLLLSQYDQLKTLKSFAIDREHLFGINEFSFSANANPELFSIPEEVNGHNIIGIDHVSSNGVKYEYGIPIYSNSEHHSSFSIESGQVDQYDNPRLVDYESLDNTIYNSKGETKYYKHEVIPKYAKSFLLTAVFSNDYVDLENDGPTEDDLGSYTKINYTKVNDNFKWRTPVEANKGLLQKGFLSNDYDDKAVISWGSKEVYYVNSVETKTHVAEFVISERLDAKGNIDKNGGVDNQMVLFKLDRINLYSKNDPSKTPIQTIHFEYDYSLYPGCPNSSGQGFASDPNDINSNGSEIENVSNGKLTLKRVWSEDYLQKNKELSSFEFSYYDDFEYPGYSPEHVNMWGQYEDFDFLGYVQKETSFVGQKESDSQRSIRQISSEMYKLKSIRSPGGGETQVEYESDDYGYVQNKQAMQMSEIIGFSEIGSTTIQKTGELNKNETVLYFELPNDFDNTELAAALAESNSCLNGIDEAYFMAYTRLMKDVTNNSIWHKDYVKGFLKPIPQSADVFWDSDLNKFVGSFQFELEPLRDIDFGNDVHPIRKAGWQYMNSQRNDLYGFQFQQNGGEIVDVLAELGGQIMNGIKFTTGFYNNAKLSNWCKHLEVNDSRKSFVRINIADGIKYGGGSRVKSVRMKDNWDQVTGQSSSTYGKDYHYTVKNGDGEIVSSGVASNEPMGLVENPFFYPERFEQNNFLIPNLELFDPYPVNFELFPGAQIGYSRVVVTPFIPSEIIDGEDVLNSETQIGISESCFYTSKDFPVYFKSTELLHKENFVKFKWIPYVGTLFSADHHSMSQGFMIETNDMHGKKKANRIYGFNDDIENLGEPTFSQEFIYKKIFDIERGLTRLDNSCDLMSGMSNRYQGEIGVSEEIIVEEAEVSSRSNDVEGQGDIHITPFPIPAANVASTSMATTISTITVNRVVRRMGVLEKIITQNNSTRSEKRILAFDNITGAPVLTSNQNEFLDPVYEYNVPSHWVYQDTKVKNGHPIADNFIFISKSQSQFSFIGNGYYEIEERHNNFAVGDKVILFENDIAQGDIYWVSEINGNTIRLIDVEGNYAPGINSTNVFLSIVESGAQCQPGIPVLSITSLSDPTLATHWYVDWLNGQVDLLTEPEPFNDIGPINVSETNVTSCTGEVFSVLNVDLFNQSNIPQISVLVKPESPCEFEVIFPSIGADEVSGSFNFQWNAGTSCIDLVVNGQVHAGEYSDGNSSCIGQPCIDGVLHAEATKLVSNYEVHSKEEVVVNGQPLNINEARMNNPIRFSGRARLKSTSKYLYQTQRKQSKQLDFDQYVQKETNTRIDGTYEKFQLFSWVDPPEDEWIKSSENTKYNEFGNPVESVDPLGISMSSQTIPKNGLTRAQLYNSNVKASAVEDFEFLDQNGDGDVSLLEYSEEAVFPFVNAQVVDKKSHTGECSLKIHSGNTASNSGVLFNPNIQTGISPQLSPNGSCEYYCTLWFNSDAEAEVKVSENGSVITSSLVQDDGVRMGEWIKVDFKITFDSTLPENTPYMVEIDNQGSEPIYIDDFRFHPFEAELESFVYDPDLFRLTSKLDRNNFATKYLYNASGELYQVKVETERGFLTTQIGQKNTRQINPFVN